MREIILDIGFWILDWNSAPARAAGPYGVRIQSKIQAPKSKTLRIAALFASFHIALVGAASAQSLHDRIQHANGLLRSGEVDHALDSYHEIQIDHPDSPVLEYNIGCAEYEKGVKALQSEEKKTGDGPWSQAIESFDRAIQSGDPVVSERAAFNRANCLAQTAKSLGEGNAQGDRVKAFQNAIRAYEDVLKADPENEGAIQNIDHLRYTMKKTPPPPPPQQGGDESKPQEDQSGEDQNQQQQEQNDTSDQQDPENKPQQQENDEKASQPDQPQDQQDQSDNRGDQQQDSGQSEQGPNEEEPDAGTPPPDRQSVEALLQSLENQDKEMQKDLRKGARTARVRPSGWW